MMNPLMKHLDRVYAELKTAAPHFFELRPAGCSEEVLARVENQLLTPLPEEVRALYAYQDGSGVSLRYGSSPWLSLNDSLFLLGTTLEEGRAPQAAASRGVRNCGWSLGWLPIRLFANGDMYALDLDPGEGGRLAQVLISDHSEMSPRVAFSNMLAFFKNQLEVATFEELQDFVDAGEFTDEEDDEVEFDEFEEP